MFGRFKQRSYQLERLDTGDYTPAEYAKWQREMKVIHRIFGESRALRNSLLHEITTADYRVSILDVGAGSGELLNTISEWKVEPEPYLAGAELNTEAVKSICERGFASIQCNALRLPFVDDGFDYVICSLILHHLTDKKAIELLSEMKRVARKSVIVIDLHRSPVAYYFYRCLGKLFLQNFTLEDGSLSILRGFKPVELEDLAFKAGMTEISIRRSAAYRLVLSGR